jgi:hypothetical protein
MALQSYSILLLPSSSGKKIAHANVMQHEAFCHGIICVCSSCLNGLLLPDLPAGAPDCLQASPDGAFKKSSYD